MTIQQWFVKPGSWCQGAYARGPSGREVETDSRVAVSYCLAGAAMRCYPQAADRAKVRAHLCKILRGTITPWNDAPGRTITEVRRLVKRAKV